jgi:peptide/nickel transport system permease protein
MRWGLAVLVLIAAGGLLLPQVLPDYRAQVFPPLLGPSLSHPFGTDWAGRDLLARVALGARVSLTIGLTSAAIAATLGAAVGLVAGSAGGLVDALLMRCVDAALAIPRLFVPLLILAVLDRIPLPVLVVVLGITGWFTTSRLVRGEVLRLKEEPFILAAEALGARRGRIIFRHLVPNCAGPLIVAGTLAVADVLLLEAGLSFLGLGVQAPTPSWGAMIYDGRSSLVTVPWPSLFPGLAIVVTVLAVNLVGEGLRLSLSPARRA